MFRLFFFSMNVWAESGAVTDYVLKLDRLYEFPFGFKRNCLHGDCDCISLFFLSI